jgi:hypothetical protein
MPPTYHRLQQRVLRLALCLGTAWLCLYVAYRLFLAWTRIDPPPGAGAGQARPQPQLLEGRQYAGASWLGHDRGVWEFHLEGDPFSLGYSHARLGTPLVMAAEDYMFDEMHRYVPSQAALFLIRLGVLFRYRDLPRHIPAPLRLELAGLAEGQPDLHGDFLPIYHRVVFYHSLHDITQTLERSPMLGCTALAAAGTATRDGHLLIGRNFDFEGPPIFDREKAVLLFKPRGKLAFASVAWAGMVGVVTGLNVAGVYVSVNALRSEDKGAGGEPVELLLREVLESAHTLDEAIDILTHRPVLVPDLYLVGDGKTGEAAIIERSPTRAAVRRSRDHGDLLGLANHALSPPFAGDRESERLRTYLTSGARQARVDELLREQRGRLDPLAVQAILRDKRGAGGAPLGLGNRNALDALIATHSVVVDVTALTLWVGVGPHALGRYVGFDLRRELLGEDRPPPPDLPVDPLQGSAELRAFEQARQALDAAAVLRRQHNLPYAIEEAELALALQPRSADAALLLGDLYYERAQNAPLSKEERSASRAASKAAYARFLTLSPPYKHDEERAQARLNSL